MPQLSDLKGTNGKPRDCELFWNVSTALKILRKGLPATAAGNSGAINFYRGDDGEIQCEVMRYMAIQESVQFKTLKEAKAWLADRLPTIQ